MTLAEVKAGDGDRKKKKIVLIWTKSRSYQTLKDSSSVQREAKQLLSLLYNVGCSRSIKERKSAVLSSKAFPFPAMHSCNCIHIFTYVHTEISQLVPGEQ